MDDGTTLIKHVSPSGIVSESVYSFPEVTTTEKQGYKRFSTKES